jgi:propionyl-CoA synthetase
MIPETIFTMLACARIGAIHSVVFGGFSEEELAKRIDDVRPKLIVTASYGIEVNRKVEYKYIVDRAQDLSIHKIKHCVIYERPGMEVSFIKIRDIEGNLLLDNSTPIDCYPVDSNHPLYILYTSGTTGIAKGVVRDSGGYLVALQWSMEHIYGTSKTDVYWAASDLGWVVGHSFIIYGPLVQGCTTVLFEGKPVGTPDAGTFWRIIEEYNVNILFTAPTAIRSIRQKDPEGVFIDNYNLSSLRTLFLAGES